jgi:hypothetical protein
MSVWEINKFPISYSLFFPTNFAIFFYFLSVLWETGPVILQPHKSVPVDLAKWTPRPNPSLVPIFKHCPKTGQCSSKNFPFCQLPNSGKPKKDRKDKCLGESVQRGKMRGK